MPPRVRTVGPTVPVAAPKTAPKASSLSTSNGTRKKKAEEPAPKHRNLFSQKQEAPKGEGSRFLNIGVNEKIMFSKHLAIMLDSGIPLREALEVQREETTSKPIKRILDVAIADLSNGFALSTALGKFPRVFPPFSVNMVRVGEASGTLSKALQYEAIELEKSHELAGKVKGALTYPVIILFGAVGISFYLSFFILPTLVPVFSSMSVKLPATTRALMAGSTFLRQKWYLVLGVMAVIAAVFYTLWRIKPIRFFLQKVTLHLPLFGKLMRGVQVARVTRVLGTLLASGVHIVEAIKVTANSMQNLVYKAALTRIAEQVERGEEITTQLVKEKALFPAIVTGMVKIGDRTGKLSESLITAAEFSEKEVDVLTKTLSTLIEPITLLLVGALVGFIALSIITPIYDLTSSMS